MYLRDLILDLLIYNEAKLRPTTGSGLTESELLELAKTLAGDLRKLARNKGVSIHIEKRPDSDRIEYDALDRFLEKKFSEIQRRK